MGLTDKQAAILRASLRPVLTDADAITPKPELVTEDPTIGNEERLRGIPVVGRVSGTIKGTRPGDRVSDLDRDARDLNEHARLLVQQRMRAARQRLSNPNDKR